MLQMIGKTKRAENTDKKISGNNFISGVFVLSFSTVLVKIIGLLYKIPMLSLLGAEGMGYFNSAYEIFALICIISTTGLPVALSMKISQIVALDKNSGEARRIFGSAMRMALLFGIVGTFALAFGASQISSLVGNYDSVYCIIAIAPSVFFVCISSVYRGYFQGMNNMHPTAVSQIIEVAGKLLLGVVFAYISLKRGMNIPTSAAFAALGLTLGMFFSCVYLVIQKRTKKYIIVKNNNEFNSDKKYFGTLLKIAIPITLSSLIVGTTRIMDMALIMRRMQDTGTSIFDANKLYGAYTTLALPIFSLVPSLISPISLALIPNLTAAIEKKNISEQSEIGKNAIRLTLLLAVPSSLGIAFFSNAILNILFSNETNNIAIVSPLLAVLGVSVLFSCLITTTNAILHSYKKTFLPIIAMLCGAGVKFVSEYFLIGNSSVGMFGAPISTLLCDMTIAFINLVNVLKCAPQINDIISNLWRVFLASLLSVGAARTLYGVSYNMADSVLLSFLPAVLVAVILYFILVYATKAVLLDDLTLLPKTDKILNLIKNTKRRKNYK